MSAFSDLGWPRGLSFSEQLVHNNTYKHKYSPWITSGIIRSIKYRDLLYRKLTETDALSPEHSDLANNLSLYNSISGWQRLITMQRSSRNVNKLCAAYDLLLMKHYIRVRRRFRFQMISWLMVITRILRQTLLIALILFCQYWENVVWQNTFKCEEYNQYIS